MKTFLLNKNISTFVVVLGLPILTLAAVQGVRLVSNAFSGNITVSSTNITTTLNSEFDIPINVNNPDSDPISSIEISANFDRSFLSVAKISLINPQITNLKTQLPATSTDSTTEEVITDIANQTGNISFGLANFDLETQKVLPGENLKLLPVAVVRFKALKTGSTQLGFSTTPPASGTQINLLGNPAKAAITQPKQLIAGNITISSPVNTPTNTPVSPTTSPTNLPSPTNTPPSTDTTWTYCAYQGNFCSFSGTRLVRYGSEGAGNKFFYQTFTNGTECNDEVFGGDPAPSYGKDCFYSNSQSTISPTLNPTPTLRPTNTPVPTSTSTPTTRPSNSPTPTPRPTSTPISSPTPRIPTPTSTPTPTVTPATPTSWTFCANENEYCNFAGTRTIRYGTSQSGNYVYKTFTGGVTCNNSTFGDPAVGYNKSCHYETSTISSSPAPNPTISIAPTPTQSSIVKVYAAGSQSLGVYPNINLLINGSRVVQWQNVIGDVNNRSFVELSYNHTSKLVPGNKIRVQFPNDRYIPGISDRNLFIDKIIIDNTTYEAEDSGVYARGVYYQGSCRSGNFSTEKLSCNGYFEFTVK